MIFDKHYFNLNLRVDFIEAGAIVFMVSNSRYYKKRTNTMENQYTMTKLSA